ncbi:thiamine phosphate synthase [Acidiphilium acidophilum]|uniref:Thiamine phosphate synthase n=1 Tax=Acidiphilium acidophilum TaxID=76588 RepID=A0AAW9DNB4_ACIAO|nr:thiamine phosphate synthase [Acidiphilium acidophilum]MDX5930049.1 thiamine phosphate synthase [Acidiphilium acidophilum]
MDQQLISQARAVKRRRRTTLPTLFLFTDAAHHPDLAGLVARLPRDIAGIVFRHDGFPARNRLARRIARICRARRLALVIAGDWRLAAACRAGLHLRGGARPRTAYRGDLTTASVHDRAQLVAARRAGANIIFISPAHPTSSHPGEPALGPVRWAALARHSPIPTIALGGMTGHNLRSLGRHCAGAGAIGALAGP